MTRPALRSLRVVLIAAALVAEPTHAATYHVDTANPSASDANAGTRLSPWKTVGRCAATLVAGDTCVLMDGGAYDERVTPANNGTSGAPITYEADVGAVRPRIKGFVFSGKSYQTVDGIEITDAGFTPNASPAVVFHGSDHVTLNDIHVHDTHAVGLSARETLAIATNFTITDSIVTNTGEAGHRAISLLCHCSDSLISGNDISHGEDAIRLFGQRNVVRNNVISGQLVSDVTVPSESNGHLDGVQSYCNGTTPEFAWDYTLLEGNVYWDNTDADSHFALVNDTDTCGGSTNVIVRGNVVYRAGSASYQADANRAGPTYFHELYNNTVVGTGVAYATHYSAILNGVGSGAVINNVFVDAIQASPPYSCYLLGPSGDGRYNLGYFTTGSVTWASPIGVETGRQLNVDPLFVSATDFHLRATSPAIDQGGALTTVAVADGGSGTTLVLTNAAFFQPGWAGTSPDCIAVGTTSNQACITSIDYATNTVTLSSPISRSDLDDVWLYSDSDRTRVLQGSAPDKGAFEFSPAGSSQLRTVRWATPPIAPRSQVFATIPCTKPSDIDICDEAAGIVEDVFDPILPASIVRDGPLVYLGFDAALGSAGTVDLIHVEKDPAMAGNIVVR